MKKIAISLLLILSLGCSPVKNIQYIPVEKTKVEYISKVDTTIIRDSVFINRWNERDTVFLTKEKFRYISKIKRDTVFRTDTIPVVKEIKVSEKYIPEYYRRINFLFWCIVALIVIFMVMKIYIRWKR